MKRGEGGLDCGCGCGAAWLGCGCLAGAWAGAACLLELEDVLDEEVVKGLVCKVDAELGERVEDEILEAEDVQDTGREVAGGDGDVIVDDVDAPVWRQRMEGGGVSE